MGFYFNIVEIIKHKSQNGDSADGKISYMVHSYLPGTSIHYMNVLAVVAVIIILTIIVSMLLKQKSKTQVMKHDAPSQKVQSYDAGEHMKLF